jgi:ATP-binding cassette subfamily F protein uup
MGDGGELSAEQFLERFGFPRPMLAQTLSRLSGGELRRLLLVRLLIAAPNVLLLDEPTNDFDIPTIALLEDFLSGFSGCVIAVSHDRAFLEGAADSLWILDGMGGVTSRVGSYSDWREEAAAAAAEASEAALAAREAASRRESARTARSPSVASASDAAPPSGKLSFRERKEFDGLMAEIETLEAEKNDWEGRFADPTSAFPRDADASAAARRRYDEVGRLIQVRTERWEELAERAGL